MLIMVDTFILLNFDLGFAVYDVLTGDIVRKLHHNPLRVSNRPDRDSLWSEGAVFARLCVH